MPSDPASRKRKSPEGGWHLIRHGQIERAFRLAKRDFAAARDAADTQAMAASLAQIAWCCALSGQPEQGLDCAIGAKLLWRRLGNRAEEARAAAVEAFLLFDLGLSDEGFEAADDAVAMAEGLSDASVLAFASCMRAIALSLCRQPELALPVIRQSVRIAEQEGDRVMLSFYLLNLGFCLIKRADGAAAEGDLTDEENWLGQAIEATEDAIAAAAEVGNSWCLRAGLGNVAELYARGGDLLRAQERLATWGEVKGRPVQSLKIHYLYTYADVMTRLGRADEAAKASRSALKLAEKTGQTDHELNAVEKLAQAYEAMGDFGRALAMQKRFHSLYVKQSGETTQRRARVVEIRLETERLRARADELASQAMRDGLTGIANRRAFDAELARLTGQPLAVAMLDLDHFKAINDRFSHMVGDEVLRRLAQILTAHVGAKAARLGGEEFALLLPGVGEREAADICETVRAAVASEDWADIAGGLAVTVSMGVALTTEGVPGGELLAVADRRLYAAKALGRNRVVGGGDMREPGFSRVPARR